MALLLGLLWIPLAGATLDPECERLLESLRGGALNGVKVHMSHRIYDADNAKFIEIATAETPPPGALFVHVENAILKSLNDKYFLDKELSASVVALYKSIFMEEFRQHVFSGNAVVYADYKGLRIFLPKDSSRARKEIEKIHIAAAHRFAEKMRTFPAFAELMDKDGGIVTEPQGWHMTGIGRTADEAAVAARMARHFSRGGAHAPAHSFQDKELHQGLNDKVVSAEETRKRIEFELSPLKPLIPLLTQAEEGSPRKILSRELIDILRKVPAHNRSEYISTVQERVRNRFEVELSEDQVSRLQKYLHLVDGFAPSIFELKEMTDLGLSEARYGIISVDLAGQNVRNLFHAMKALARIEDIPHWAAHPQLTELALKELRKEQTLASQEFEVRRKHFGETLSRLFPQLPINDSTLRISGDDAIYLPTHRLTYREKMDIVQAMSQLGTASDYRMVFLPPNFLSTTIKIPEKDRAYLTGLMEGLEKNIRLDLEHKHFPISRLKETTIALSLSPQLGKPHKVTVMLGGRGTQYLTHPISEIVKARLPEGFVLETVAHQTDSVSEVADLSPKKATVP